MSMPMLPFSINDSETFFNRFQRRGDSINCFSTLNFGVDRSGENVTGEMLLVVVDVNVWAMFKGVHEGLSRFFCTRIQLIKRNHDQVK